MGSCCCSKKKEDSGKLRSIPLIQRKSSALVQASSPSNLPTNDLTIVYELPSDTYKTVTDVIKSHGYQILEELGTGAYAVVNKAKRLRDGSIFACKIMNLSEGKDVKQKSIDAKNELFVMEKTDHPHIVKLYEHFVVKTRESKAVYIFMQFAEGDSLSKIMREAKHPCNEEVAKKWFAQMVSAVHHMHLIGIAHRDLKMGNILLDKHSNILVSDFGLSRVAYRASKGGTLLSHTFCVTIQYMAPEVLINKLEKHDYNPFLADIWALGVVLFCIVNRAYPFDINKPIRQILDQQLNGQLTYSRHILAKPSNHLDNIFKRLFQPNVNKRIKISELVDHKWIKDEIVIISKKIKT